MMNQLEAMIPSSTVRRFVEISDYQFTDWQKASMIYHSSALTLKETQEQLDLLKSQTNDKSLSQQIDEYLREENSVVREFQNNYGKNFVYLVMICDDDGETAIVGCYFYHSDAYDAGKDSGHDFTVRKQRIVSGTDTSYSIELDFDTNGDLTDIRADNFYLNKYQDHERFETMYYEVPNPFNRGDLVRNVDTHVLGVIEISYQDYIKQIQSKLTNCGMADLDCRSNEIPVTILDADGHVEQEYLDIPDLELWEYKGECETEAQHVKRLILEAVSRLYKGESSLAHVISLIEEK